MVVAETVPRLDLCFFYGFGRSGCGIITLNNNKKCGRGVLGSLGSLLCCAALGGLTRPHSRAEERGKATGMIGELGIQQKRKGREGVFFPL